MNWKLALVRFTPIASFGLCLQALFVLVWPKDSISIEFLLAAHNLFISEIVLMHASIFWIVKNDLFKSRWQRWVFGLFLTAAYSLFIIPLAQKNFLLGISYFVFCAAHFFEFDQKHWLQDTKVLQKFIPPKDHPIILSAYSLLKACYLGLFLTIVSSFLPAHSDLNPEYVSGLTGDPENAGYKIDAAKSLFLYFLGLTVFDFFFFLKKFKKV